MVGLLSFKLSQILHFIFVVCLVLIVFLQGANKIFESPGIWLICVSTIAGILFAFCYFRIQGVRTFLTVLTPSVVIFPGFFLYSLWSSTIIFPPKQPPGVYEKIKSEISVVMVVFDELSLSALLDERGHIDPFRYPNFAALANDSYWARNATTVSVSTLSAIPSILTGNYPIANGLAAFSDYPNNLFSFLGGSYDLQVYESVTKLCPKEYCQRSQGFISRAASMMIDLPFIFFHLVLPSDLTFWLPDIQKNWHLTVPFRAQWQIELRKDRKLIFQDFIDSIQPGPQPGLHFLHILLPHIPYEFLPSGKSYPSFRIKDMQGKAWVNDLTPVVFSNQRYLLQVEFVDLLIGKLMKHLREVKLYNNSLIIVTSDHGVGFFPGDKRRFLTQTNVVELISVPLFFKLPGQINAVNSDRNIELIDILPTIADVLGVSLGWNTDGISIFDETLQRSKKHILRKILTDLNSFERGKEEALKRKWSLFGYKNRFDSLYRISPYSEVIGTEVQQIGVKGLSKLKIKMREGSPSFNLESESSKIPAMVGGIVISKEDLSEPVDLAIAVNGVIHGVTRSFGGKEKETTFAVMIPEKAFRVGNNKLEVFTISLEKSKIFNLKRILY